MLKKVLLGLVITIIVLIIIGLSGIYAVGAWNLVFPNRTHDSIAPTLPKNLPQPAILVFSKTNGFRHTDGIAGGNAFFAKLANQNGWGLFATENGAVFNTEDLAKFDTVIFNSASGDMLSDEQEIAFQQWLENGGGWLGMHASGDGSHKDWTWYQQTMFNVDYLAHIMNPQFQTATVNLENIDHPVLADIPTRWQHEEEWYSWEESPRRQNITVLATIDEDTYTPVADFMGKQTDLHMGDHPIIWARCVNKGRAVYSAVGHRAIAFNVPEITQLLENVINWTNGTTGDHCQ